MSIVTKVLALLMVIGLGFTAFNMLVTPYMLASLSQGDTAIEASVVNRVKKSIVALHSTPPFGMRSGLILNNEGLVVTLGSTVGVKNAISGYFTGEQVSLKNLHSVNYNLALLRMTKSGNLPTVEFADEDNIKIGQKVFLVAATSTEQDTWVVREGSISQVNGEIITTDIIGNPEESSSPLFNTAGELLGIAYLDGSGKISAVPVNKIKALKGI